MKKQLLIIICAFSFILLAACSSTSDTTNSVDTSAATTEVTPKSREALNKEKDKVLLESQNETTDEYVESTSPEINLPYNPDAEWNYVPLD